VLLRAYPTDQARAATVLSFFRWALDNGQELAGQSGYLPLPASLVDLVKASWGAGNRRS